MITTSPPHTKHHLSSFIVLGIFIQALLATVGSLYYSTFGDIVKNLHTGQLFDTANAFIPCNLCWIARILMYPIVPLSYISLVRKDFKIYWYILPLSVAGIALESYHYALQKIPGLKTVFTCTASNPCNALQVNYLGFITIPFLCLVAFVVITVLAVWLMKIEKSYTAAHNNH